MSKLKLIFNKIDMLLQSLEVEKLSKESDEWYLANNLISYKSKMKSAESAHEVYQANYILRHFLIDSMDWETNETKVCTEILFLGDEIEKERKFIEKSNENTCRSDLY